MSDEEKAAREKLDAAKTLLEKNYQPKYGTDKNLLDMAQARLTAGSIEGVTVAMKAAVSTKDMFTDAACPASMRTARLHYKWNDNGTTSSTTLYCRPTLTLACGAYNDEAEDVTVALGLDEGKGARSAAHTGAIASASRRS